VKDLLPSSNAFEIVTQISRLLRDAVRDGRRFSADITADEIRVTIEQAESTSECGTDARNAPSSAATHST
jgi:hypothetical protein